MISVLEGRIADAYDSRSASYPGTAVASSYDFGSIDFSVLVLERKSAANLEKSRNAQRANASLIRFTTYDDGDLEGMAIDFLHNSIADLVAKDSASHLYGFSFSVQSEAGLGATEAEVADAERIESISTNQKSPNPLVVVPDASAAQGWRRLKSEDIFGPRHTRPAYIKRFIVTANLCDAQAAERHLHLLLEADALGFRGNIRNGGLSTKQGPYLFGVGVLVIPDGLTAMGLAVRNDHRDAFLAACTPTGGRRVGIKLPLRRPGPFPPKDSRGGFVLGGPIMHAARGLVKL